MNENLKIEKEIFIDSNAILKSHGIQAGEFASISPFDFPYFYTNTFCSVSVCNITLDSRQLFSKSDRGFGQIKSPYLQGPSRCTYRFVPDTGQRVELQIYRLVSIGRHNGTA
ncbi:hypothetical protein P5V15_002316 [Pogonomyrmex californicus]